MEIYELVFKIEKGKSHIRILGEKFFNRNISSSYFIYNNMRFILKDKLESEKIKEKEGEFKIIMIFLKSINNKSFMFQDCESLIKFSIYKKEKKENSSYTTKLEEELNYLIDFYQDNNNSNDSSNDFLEDFDSFPDYSEISENEQKSNDSKKLTMKSVFNNLKPITENLVNLKGIFKNCSSLLYLNNISEWDTYKVEDMSEIFYGCSSLSSIPDISIRNTSNVVTIRKIFQGCSSLL